MRIPVMGSESLDGINSRSVAPVTFVIHTEAKQEAVFNSQPGKIRFQTRSGLAVMLFVYQHCSQYFHCSVSLAVIRNGAQGRTFIENVVDNNDGPATHVNLGAKLPFQNAASGFL